MGGLGGFRKRKLEGGRGFPPRKERETEKKSTVNYEKLTF